MPTRPDGLEPFLPVVAGWFRETFGAPTPPQRLGWASIAAGRHTLISAPTGSGKTLAAFLACLDHLWRVPRTAKGVRILYISPLKALNQDIARNLDAPLRGILDAAESQGVALAPLRTAVRSGDTPQAERQRAIRNPPDILITTPESLHLMLTSRARETLRSVSHVIVDEIHALCPNKRGVFLSLLLERLEALNPQSFLRVGLSATQKPLDEAARYLGGFRPVVGADADGITRLEPRPVSVVDAGQRKTLDLEVVYPFGTAAGPPSSSVWPAIESQLAELIRNHRSTIIFANNRRVAERLTARLNDRLGSEGDEAVQAPDGDEPAVLVRSHHGSLSPEERRATEEALKRGELPAVVATASLELGIDMGAVDLVCQVESPGSVARGLQRVGRAGHLVGRVSKGRLFAKTAADLAESAALCRKMLGAEVEELRVPTNCLDVLAQQVVACVAVDRWDAPALFELVRRAYPYRDLTASAFESVLKMVSGRFPVDSFRDLRARVSWDRVHNRLAPLPGTARVAIVNGGTIPDTGQYPVTLGDDGPRLGELDEEFVLERRAGETFVLGTATWRIEAIEPQRVVVAPAEGRSSLAPFWRGENAPRTAELGRAVGSLCREIVEAGDDPGLTDRLRDAYHLTPDAARALRDFVSRQARAAGAVPDDRTVLVESFVDPAGETGLAVLTPFGGKLHHALKLLLLARLRQRLGITPACLHADDGLLIRLPQTDEPPLDLFDGLGPDDAEVLVRAELADSALFGLRFRQNAGRALLMPRPDPSKRTPLWLQRLRARDLLQVVRKFPDFPIVVETYRECLADDLDMPRLREFLGQIRAGSIRVVTRRGEIPSPFASSLIFRFERHFLYQWDEPRRPDAEPRRPAVDEELLGPLLAGGAGAHLLDPRAVGRVEGRLRGAGQPPRSIEEMADALLRLGDLTASELSGPMLGFLRQLESEGRAVALDLPGTREPARWVHVEDAPLYRRAFGPGDEEPSDALDTILRRFLRTHALVGLDDLTARYPIGPGLATEALERWETAGDLVRLDPVGDEPDERWADGRNLAEVCRLSVALRRQESVAVAPEVFAEFLIRRQHVHPATRRDGSAAVEAVLEQLQGHAAPADLWETEILPARVRDYRPGWLDEALGSGVWHWRAEAETRDLRAAFLTHELSVAHRQTDRAELSETAARVLDLLGRLGASFTTDLARASGLEPSRVRQALQELIGCGLATNDRFDPLRPGAQAVVAALAEAAHGAPARRPSAGRLRVSPRRPSSTRPEGRWSRLDAHPGDALPLPEEDACLAWASVLLDRYGVLTRETAALDPWAPSWRNLAPWLARAEMRGEVRRGYFVEGLSGVQYATAEAAEGLARCASAVPAGDAPVLISTLDPANLYGSGAPFDIPLLDGGTTRLSRSPANFLVLRGGRPLLIVEGHGRRLTGLASASETELAEAVVLLTRLARPSRRVLKVETYNGTPALGSPAEPWLAAAGFVRDPPGMAFYAGW
jgi:ATP-dependent Lhr-like helicase